PRCRTRSRRPSRGSCAWVPWWPSLFAATPFSLGGITSGFWALVAGVLASLAARERGLLALRDPDQGEHDGTHTPTPGPRRSQDHGQRHLGHDFRPAERADH